jgi:hypothetical protein
MSLNGCGPRLRCAASPSNRSLAGTGSPSASGSARLEGCAGHDSRLCADRVRVIPISGSFSSRPLLRCSRSAYGALSTAVGGASTPRSTVSVAHAGGCVVHPSSLPGGLPRLRPSWFARAESAVSIVRVFAISPHRRRPVPPQGDSLPQHPDRRRCADASTRHRRNIRRSLERDADVGAGYRATRPDPHPALDALSRPGSTRPRQGRSRHLA